MYFGFCTTLQRRFEQRLPLPTTVYLAWPCKVPMDILYKIYHHFSTLPAYFAKELKWKITENRMQMWFWTVFNFVILYERQFDFIQHFPSVLALKRFFPTHKFGISLLIRLKCILFSFLRRNAFSLTFNQKVNIVKIKVNKISRTLWINLAAGFHGMV